MHKAAQRKSSFSGVFRKKTENGRKTDRVITSCMISGWPTSKPACDAPAHDQARGMKTLEATSSRMVWSGSGMTEARAVMPGLSEGLVYLDEDLLVLDKPAGLLAVPGRGEDK